MAGGLTKIAEAQVQLDELNKKLAVQKVAVTEKTAACESLLETIAEGSKTATEKKEMAVSKGQEIEEQSKIIVVEKVCSLISPNTISQWLNGQLVGSNPEKSQWAVTEEAIHPAADLLQIIFHESP